MRVLYRADGSPAIGTGHIARGLILRRRLSAMGAHVTFVTRDLPWGLDALRREGCDVITFAGDADTAAECAALREAVRTVSPDACVMDVLETSAEVTRIPKQFGCRLICLDDVGAGRLNADAIVNILEVEPEPEMVEGRGIALFQGPAYAALAEVYAEPGIAAREIPQKVRRILVTLGGADPGGLAPKAARALKRAFDDARAACAFEEPHVMLLIGSASPRRAAAMRAVRGAASSFTMADSVPSLLPALREADLGIVAGGLTMHEALATGLPSIALCQEVRHQAELAQRLAEQGALLTLGRGAGVAEAKIAAAVLDLAADADLRRRLASGGAQLVDGRGAERTAEVILRGVTG